MKYWVSLVNTVEVDQFIAIARHAEQLGFEGVTVPDHLIMPTRAETPYPYTADGQVWWPDDLPWPDPWITLTAMGVATTRLRLATNIYLAALRDPFTAARAISGADIFTGGRVACGVSAGWLKEEFDAVGVDFESRGRRLDETIEVMRKLWTGEPVAHSGEFFDFREVILSPKPVSDIPVWVGGISTPALKRAAANDGWLGVPMPNAQLFPTVERLFELRKQAGTYGQPFDVFITATELITAEMVAGLDHTGLYHSSALPWTPSPWGRAPWVKEGEDPAELEVKCLAMERFKQMMTQLGLWE